MVQHKIKVYFWDHLDPCRGGVYIRAQEQQLTTSKIYQRVCWYHYNFGIEQCLFQYTIRGIERYQSVYSLFWIPLVIINHYLCTNIHISIAKVQDSHSARSISTSQRHSPRSQMARWQCKMSPSQPRGVRGKPRTNNL